MCFNKPIASIEQALQYLQAAGFRVTKPRRAVLRALFEARGWLRPDGLRSRARRYCPSLGLVTVYRTLSLLEGLGVVRRIHLEPGSHGYAPAGRGHTHHLVCRACHQVVEFPGSEDLSPLIRQISRKTGFLVERHLLELAGLCPDCR